MVARTFWRSEALTVVPSNISTLTYGLCRISDQGTTRCASDLCKMHGQPFLNPFIIITQFSAKKTYLTSAQWINQSFHLSYLDIPDVTVAWLN